MSVVHFTHAYTGGAGRAARRAHLACQAAGIESNFAYVQGDEPGIDEVKIGVAADGYDLDRIELAKILVDRIQWGALQERRTGVSNTLLSLPYPGIDLDRHRLFETADIVHLHWPTWAVTPRQVANWLAAGRVVFWTLHDFWAMTGGCHYPAGCEQYQTVCMKCPQLFDDPGFVPNSFAEKQRLFGAGGSLYVVTPSQWLAERAGRSAILGGRSIAAVPNPIELDLFRPPTDRNELRAGIGVGESDLVLLFGGYDLSEKRKGFSLLRDALQDLLASGALAECLPSGADIYIGLLGKSTLEFDFPGCTILNFGNVDEDEVMADILGLADLICVPSLEDNYPNFILEGMSCGTPSLGFAAGGVPEMIRDRVTGILGPNIGSVQALKDGILRFATEHFRDTAMRHACRAAVEQANEPAAVGKRLRQLYESALGRPLRGGPVGMHRRVARVLAKAEMLPDVRLGSDFLQFPLNLLLRARGADEDIAVQPPAERGFAVGQSTRLMTLRTRHEHHSARSGPYQFARHLPRGAYELSHVTVPLGSELAGPAASLYRDAGSFLGAPAFGQQANNWLAETELASRCLTEPVDLVHFIDGEHAGWLLPSLPAALFGASGKPRFVTTFHQPPQGLERLVNRRLLARYDGIIALCQSQKDYLSDYVDPMRVFVVPHGVDTEFFHPDPQQAGPPEWNDPFQLLAVGHWLRDFESAFAALGLLEQAGVAAELTIVSPSPIRPGDPRVSVRSELSDEELRKAYRSADALLLPLLDATANNAILEAMACGTPVISTRVGGVPKMVGAGAAILCPPRDPSALADAVMQLASRPQERATMGKAARRRAEELDWRIIGQLHHDVYQEILRSRR